MRIEPPLGALPSFLEPVGDENRAAKMPEPTAESAPVDSGACKHIPGLPVQFAMGVAVSRIEKSQNLNLQQKIYRIATWIFPSMCAFFLPGVVCFRPRNPLRTGEAPTVNTTGSIDIHRSLSSDSAVPSAVDVRATCASRDISRDRHYFPETGSS